MAAQAVRDADDRVCSIIWSVLYSGESGQFCSSVLASLGPVITGVLARVMTSERLSRLQGIGAGLIVLGNLAVVYQR